jgi:hypothetical protein
MELDTDEEELIVAAAARRRARDKARGAETLVTRLKRMVGASTCASRTVPTLLQRGTVAIAMGSASLWLQALLCSSISDSRWVP